MVACSCPQEQWALSIVSWEDRRARCLSDQLGWTPRYEQKPKDCTHLVQIHCLCLRGDQANCFQFWPMLLLPQSFPLLVGAVLSKTSSCDCDVATVHFYCQYLRNSTPPYFTIPYSTLSNPTLPYHTLPYPTLPYPTLTSSSRGHEWAES